MLSILKVNISNGYKHSVSCSDAALYSREIRESSLLSTHPSISIIDPLCLAKGTGKYFVTDSTR